jgi:uncharacterized membrane protein YkgB
MNNLKTRFDQQFNTIDRQITRLMAQYGLPLMRVSLGIVFFWFGALKLLPGLSPAEELVRSTTFFVNPDWFLPVLALWEMAIGLGLIFGKAMRLTLLLLFLQMPGTMLPLFVLPEAVWTQFPHALTMEGQYIVKNLVLVAAGMVLGGTVRGGYLVSEPVQTAAVPTGKLELSQMAEI